eukprot:scaffold49927_cov69-Phaeocystis_antarctica.AAC.1
MGCLWYTAESAIALPAWLLVAGVLIHQLGASKDWTGDSGARGLGSGRRVYVSKYVSAGKG